MTKIFTTNPYALESFMQETLFYIKPSVSAPKPETIVVENTVPNITHLGSNRKGILFIVQDQEHAYFSAPAKEAFLKTLQSLKLSLDDVAVYNSASRGAVDLSLSSLKKSFTPNTLVLMDVPFPELSDLQKNSVIHRLDMRIVQTDTIDAMLHDLGKKKQFWSTMKSMFTHNG